MAAGPAAKIENDVVARIRSFEIFRSCPEEFLVQFASFAQLKSLPQGEFVLQQGYVNDRFLILASGQVEVQVEGETVAILETPGDFMGEMSAIAARVVSASLIARTDIEFFEIPARQLNPAILGNKTEFGYHLYRLLATVLSDKIINTNDKARRFESANRNLTTALNSLKEMNATLDQKVKERTIALEKKTEELARSYNDLEFQNSELLASHRKIEELYSSKDMTFKKLNDLYSALLPLTKNLENLTAAVPSEMQVEVRQAQSLLEHTVKMLLPMTELYSTEQAIRSQRVLLAEPDRKQQAIARMALGGTGVELEIASSHDELKAILASGKMYDLAFISSDLSELIPQFRKSLPISKLVFMGTSNVPAELPKLKANGPLISNIVTRHPEDRTFTVKNVATTLNKVISRDIFGLEKYMIWGVEVQERPVVASNQRAQLIDEMKEQFSELGVRNTISERAALVAEELLMNAIYDAPVNEDGKSLYNHLPRTTAVNLSVSEQGVFRYAVDGMLAAVSVSDPFGAFRMQILFDYLERNYAGKTADPQLSGKGGAGRGLHLITENADLVVFNVKSGVQTEVIAFFNLDPKAKVDGLNPSFHFFQE